jgi:hypothetical protein
VDAGISFGELLIFSFAERQSIMRVAHSRASPAVFNTDAKPFFKIHVVSYCIVWPGCLNPKQATSQTGYF